VIRISRALIVFCSYAMLCRAQVPKTDRALLTEAREKYDAPFTRNLESFDCAVDFSWKEHFKETTRVGDEGSDEELEKIFQPIRNRVTMTRQSVIVSSGFTDAEEAKLPHGGMAEGLLKHAVQKSLYNWLPASTNTLLPTLATPSHFVSSSSGYKLAFKVQSFDVEMALDPDMRLQGATAKGSQSDHFETAFVPGPQGFLLSSWTMGEDGQFERGHRLIFAYTYQTVDGIQIPKQVEVFRESHHEVWRYSLNGCTVKTSK
jgi:hypothetical protein